MQSTAVDVDAYLDEVPGERREILAAVRALCRAELVGFEEAMAYGMPGYARDGLVEVGFARQRRHISLYVLRTDVLDAFRHQLVGLGIGKGCIRYRRPSDVDLGVVRAM